jgi:hypothetical protein
VSGWAVSSWALRSELTQDSCRHPDPVNSKHDSLTKFYDTLDDLNLYFTAGMRYQPLPKAAQRLCHLYTILCEHYRRKKRGSINPVQVSVASGTEEACETDQTFESTIDALASDANPSSFKDSASFLDLKLVFQPHRWIRHPSLGQCR